MRTCTTCGVEMIEGYSYFDGLKYFCSDDCLSKSFNQEEKEILYKKDMLFYTDWSDEIDNDNEMNLYTVEIVETLVKTIEIHAKNEDEAYDTIRDKYYDGEIVLDSDDYLETQFVVKT